MSDQTGKTNAEEQAASRIIEYVDGNGDMEACDLNELRGADLRGANLRGANLWDADLRGADLTGADLWDADLRGANLRDADLRDADLRDADLWGADLRGIPRILQVNNLPSGQLILKPTPDGWHLTVGCWKGTIDSLKTLISQDDDWPEAEGDEIEHRRPSLQAAIQLCEAHIALWPNLIEELAEKWGTTPERTDTDEPDCGVQACGD